MISKYHRVRIILLGLLCGVSLMSYPLQTNAGELFVKEVLKHADRSRGDVGGITWTVHMTTFGEDDELESSNYSLKVEVMGTRSLAEFLSPPKSRGRMLLMKDKNMWFIRPGLSKAVPISPRQKLLGMASNGDIASTRYVEDYDARLLGTEVLDGVECYVLDLVATKKTVTYDRIKYWVSKAERVGVKSEFYTISGKLFKTAEFKYENTLVLEQGKSAPFVSEMVIFDAILKDRRTVLAYTDILIHPISPSRFSLNLLIRR